MSYIILHFTSGSTGTLFGTWFALSSNESVLWDIDLISEYRHYWNWMELSNNEGIQWSLKLIHIFSENFHTSKSIWNILQPHIDDEMIDDVFKKKIEENEN